MGDLANDTELTGGDGRYRATVSGEWEIWGPAGGYIAALALRAAGAHCGRARPASITVHFLRTAAFTEVDLEVTTQRDTRTGSSVRVQVTQDGRSVLSAAVWGVDEQPGLTHHTGETPDLDGPDGVPSVEERMASRPDGELARHPFWANLECRPLQWIDDWDARTEPDEPQRDEWYRFRPTAVFEDPWVDACRQLILVDLEAWGATVRGHVGELEFFAPTIEVTARFAPATNAAWLLSRARAPRATGGTVMATAELWTPDGRLVAVGGSTLLCLPAQRRPDQ